MPWAAHCCFSTSAQLLSRWAGYLNYCQLGPNGFGSAQIYPWTIITQQHPLWRVVGGRVKGCQGWITGDRLQSCTCADIGSEAGQLRKKSPQSPDHPWSYAATDISFTWNKSSHIVTLFSFTAFGLDNVQTSIWVPSQTITELGSQRKQWIFITKLQPQDTKWGGAQPENSQEVSMSAYPSPVFLLLLAAGTDRTCA